MREHWQEKSGLLNGLVNKNNDVRKLLPRLFWIFVQNIYCLLFLNLYEVIFIKATKSLDCLGLFCPEPVFNTRLQLDEMKVGETLEVTADDPAAKSDIENLAKNLGDEVLESKQEDGVTRIIIKKLK
jgi:tRNA 2-thiouridine synthesizing protein A